MKSFFTSIAVAGLLSQTEASATTPLPRVAYQLRVPMRPKGSTGAFTDTSVTLVGENGHSSDAISTNLCAQLAANYDMAADFASKCTSAVEQAMRDQRGLRVQHDPSYATAVHTHETKLNDDGFTITDIPYQTIYQSPFKTQFLTQVFRGTFSTSTTDAAASTPRTFCEVGFGAGHSTLLFFTTLPSTAGGGWAYAFDTGLQSHTIPAHDRLDDQYPNRLALLLGDSAVTINQMKQYYPEARCDVVYIDGSTTYEATKADLKGFASVVSPEHIVILANAKANSESLRAWKDLVATRDVLWEGTVRESNDPANAATTDALVYGTFSPAAGAVEVQVPVSG